MVGMITILLLKSGKFGKFRRGKRRKDGLLRLRDGLDGDFYQNVYQ